MDLGGYFPQSDSSPPTSSSSSSAADSNTNSSNNINSSINGLKFGKKIYFGDHVGLLSSTPPNPKPARKVGNQQQLQLATPRCQVEGCNVDLSDVKPYYSRHKVCGIHSKTPTVIVAGLEQRFCQQCSRFHLLPEFDQGKRSCRRRLAGHNERRRKPPPGSMLSSRYGRLSSTLFDNNSRGGGGSGGGGGFLLDFTRSSSGREASNETHPAPARSVPWQNSNPPPPNLYAQVSAVHPGECYPGTGGVSIPDSSCALSLLSNEQQWTSSRSRPPTTTTISPYQNTWHGMLQSDLGLGHVQPHLATGSEVEMSRRQYMEDMEEQSRPYGSSDQHVNWSL